MKRFTKSAGRGFTLLDGFTLLEMMLAIGILAVVMIMIADSFSAVAHSKVQGEDHLNIDREGRAIVWQLSREIGAAVQTPLTPSHVALIGTGQMHNRVPLDSVTVSTFAAGHRRAITGFAAEDIVTYSTEPSSERRGWSLLTRSQSSALGGGDSGSMVLADNVLALHIRYFNGNQWLESWNSGSLPQGQQLPVAVAIDLELGARNGRVMNFSTEVEVPMAIVAW